MRPSMNTSEPFLRYCWAISACLPQTTILCHSVRFWRSPLRSLKVSSVATEKLATAWPPEVKRVSGSRPRRPTRMTLLTDIFVLSLKTKAYHRVSGATAEETETQLRREDASLDGLGGKTRELRSFPAGSESSIGDPCR